MIVYIAGPMTGIEDYNYPAFNKAAELLTERNYTVLNPVDVEKENPTGAHQPWSWYMRRALKMVLQADAIALLPGWEKSRGASLEVQVAVALALPVMQLDEYLVKESRAKTITEARLVDLSIDLDGDGFQVVS